MDSEEREKIENWVKEKLKEGVEPSVIKQALKEKGHDMRIVDDVLKLTEELKKPKEEKFMTIPTYLIIVLVLGALIFLSLYFLIPPQTLSVLNPSFEDGMLPVWSPVTGSPEEKVELVDDIAYDGNKSLRVDFTGASWLVIVHDLRLIPFTNYEVSFYVRSTNMSKICIGYDARAKKDNSFVQWYSCPGGIISFQADGKWHRVTHRFNTNKLTEDTYGVFKFDISGCDRNDTNSAPYCEGELNNPGTLWIDGPVRISKV